MIKQEYYPKDEVLINIHEEICEELKNEKISNLLDDFINIQCVESNKNSKHNQDVADYAKITTLLVMYTSDNDRDENILMNPNDNISYNTMKNEIKYKMR